MNRIITCLLAAALPAQALATNGAFAIGYGAKQRAVGGAAVGFPQGALSGAANPANLAFVNPGTDISLEIFLPERGASLDTALKDDDSSAGLLGDEKVSQTSESPFFLVPNVAATWKLSCNLTAGMIIYANGGMNTDYAENIFHKSFTRPIGLFSSVVGAEFGPASTAETDKVKEGFEGAANTGRLGVNLEQAIMAPSVAWSLNERYAVGMSLLVGVQRFRAEGLGDFVGFSSDPANLTNNGDDFAAGVGVRGGITARPADWITIGLAGATKIYMSKFDSYAGLFAEQGGFDVPANAGAGLALSPYDALTLAVDVNRIFFGGVPSIANKGPTAEQFLGDFKTVLGNAFRNVQGTPTPLNQGLKNALGEDNGYGFGWKDIWVVKVGVAYAPNESLTIRGGYNYGESPVQDDQTLFNILAPGVMTHHITGGLSFDITDTDELSLAYMFAPEQRQGFEHRTSGAPFGFDSFVLGYDTEVFMSQQVAEVAYRRAF